MDGSVKFGDFLNEYAANPQVFLPLIVFAAMAMPTFGYFYNLLMDRLDDSHEHTSLWVAIGNLTTLTIGALFSWKAALLILVLFILDGLPMIAGDFIRDKKREATPRVKRFPYKANAFLDDIQMAGTEARRILGQSIKKQQSLTPQALIALEYELNTVLLRVAEINVIQGRTK